MEEEELVYPQRNVRCGLSAAQMRLVWESGVAAASLEAVSDAAVCPFAYCFNGLREISVCSLQTQDAELEEERLICRFHVVKGKREIRLPLVLLSA